MKLTNNQLRQAAAAVQAGIGVLVAFGAITTTQGAAAVALTLAAYHFIQSFLTPETDKDTPDQITTQK